MVLEKRPIMLCKPCSIGNAKHLVTNKNVDKGKKAIRVRVRIFSDLATIKVPQDSCIIVINTN